MLARGTKSVYVCLRCRNSPFANKLNPPGAAKSATGRVRRRWQSAASHQVAVDEVDNSHDNDKTAVERDDLSPFQHQNRPQHDGNHQRWRNWRPRPTAELGVSSLGKPAEVLLLPSRDRRITQVPRDVGKERAGTTLQDSIDSEKVPLSGAKLTENIEQVRSLVGKLRGQLEKQEWKTLTKHLRSGFQAAQLKRYIRLRKGESFPPAGLSKNPSKDQIITYMAEEIWGFTMPVLNEPTAYLDGAGKKTKLSFSLRGGAAKLEHLLTHPTQPLKRIAEECHVQVNVYPRQCQISTIGSAHHANQAIQKIVDYTKELGQVILHLQGPSKLSFPDHKWMSYLGPYLKSLQRKYQGLVIGLDVEKITIVHLKNSRAADQARREILLSAPSNAGMHNSTVWPRMDESTASLQPSPTPAELPPLLHHDQWYRLLSNSATPLTVDQVSRSTSFGQTLQSLRDTFKGSVTRGTQAGNRQELYYDITARFGQVLTQGTPPPADADGKATRNDEEVGTGDGLELAGLSGRPPLKGEVVTRAEHSQFEKGSHPANTNPSAGTPSSALVAIDKDQEVLFQSANSPGASDSRLFVGGAPFLPQLLSRMNPWIQRSSDSPGDIDGNSRAILRLQLCPVSTLESKGSPKFELLVTAGETADGKPARLKIVRVSAVHHEDHFAILCPQNTVDINFTRQLKQDLKFQGLADVGLSQHLMNALRGYIGHAQSTGSSDWVFLPFVTLPINHMLRDAYARSRQDTHKRGRGRPKGSVGPVDKKLEYLLRTVDVVDVDSRAFSVKSSATVLKQQPIAGADFCLDHVTYTGADTTRQELRLAQSPMLYPPTLTTPNMLQFLKATLKLGERLSRNPLKEGDMQDSFVCQIDDIDDEKIAAKDKEMQIARKVAQVAKRIATEALNIEQKRKDKVFLAERKEAKKTLETEQKEAAEAVLHARKGASKTLKSGLKKEKEPKAVLQEKKEATKALKGDQKRKKPSSIDKKRKEARNARESIQKEEAKAVVQKKEPTRKT